MKIGVDASGVFVMGEGFKPTVTAAAIGAASTFEEIERWTAGALERWGLGHKLSELHAKELFADKVREVCQMLSAREDLRLAAVVTDSQLLRSAAAVARHRERQQALAEETRAMTEEGRRRRAAVLALLDDPKLRDAAYAFGATLPVLVTLALQQALCYFRRDLNRADMATIDLLIDKEPARTVKYTSDTLLPTIGGDPRFSLTVPDQWREPPMHPLLIRARHPDGDGLQPQELLSTIEYVDSKDHPCVQIADIAASVVRRRILDPLSVEDRENFELLQPLLAGAEGRSFEFFSISPLREDQVSMYSHLHGLEPDWWLTPGTRSA
jgi:hypothetical protein